MSVIPLWVKLTALGALLATLVAFGWYMKGIKEDNVQLRAQQAAMIARIKKAETANARQDALFAERDEQQNEVRSGIADVTVRIKQEAANDPGTRTFNSTPLPAGLRRAILAADAARAAAECEGADCANADRRGAPDKRGTRAGSNK